MKYQFSYLIRIQYLGFRWHGWQKQKNVKTLHFAFDKTLEFVLGESKFKTLGVGRTDAKVSAFNYPIQLFVDEALNLDDFLVSFNDNAPADIRMLTIEPVLDVSFNIIQQKKIKEYHYYFSNEGKNHPYLAPFVSGYTNLDIDLMKEGAQLFCGTHFFGRYCTKPNENTELTRTIVECTIEESSSLPMSFSSNKIYALKVKSKGFLRYQIRLMMGALVALGRSEISLDDIKASLKESDKIVPLTTIAPGSGLHLYDVEFLQ